MTVDGTVPRYRRIEQELRARLASMRPGDPLPSDAALCEEFGVSRMTARNAMQLLSDEGLVQRLPGRGTFVADPPTHRRADRLMTFTSEIVRQGRKPSSRLLTREIRPSTPDEESTLGLDHAEPVVLVRRVREADGLPLAVEQAVLHRRTANAVMRADLEHGSLHEALARGGFHMRRGQATIRAGAATFEDARLLGVKRGEPLLIERRVIADTQGRRIEATESRYAGDRYALDVLFEVEESDTSGSPDPGAAPK